MLDDFKNFMYVLAKKAEEIILDYADKTNLNVDYKADSSPVTLADRQTEKTLRQLIKKKFPTHGILAEEFGNENENAEYVWVIDPIDGTKSFIAGAPLYGTLIGLMQGNKPILGSINNPVLKKYIVGDNVSCQLNGQDVCCKKNEDISKSVICTTDASDFASADKNAWLNLEKDAFFTRTWGDCYGYMLLCEGKIDAMIDPVLSPWDILPIVPILNGAKLAFTDIKGGSSLNSCVAGNEIMQKKVLNYFTKNS